MWVELFLCLLLAHLVADFVFQTNASCQKKAEQGWHSPHHYLHAFVVFALSWIASSDLHFWWCALTIGVSHGLIDIWKSYREEKIKWFVMDQLMHLVILVGISWFWCQSNVWSMPFDIDPMWLALVIAVLICWKPANIFIKLMLKHYSVKMPEDRTESGFNAGALIGNLERWLILVFVLLHHYEALGLLIAAKSIIRFGDSETRRTEYVLAGTLLSIFIAVICGLLVCRFWIE